MAYFLKIFRNGQISIDIQLNKCLNVHVKKRNKRRKEVCDMTKKQKKVLIRIIVAAVCEAGTVHGSISDYWI